MGPGLSVVPAFPPALRLRPCRHGAMNEIFAICHSHNWVRLFCRCQTIPTRYYAFPLEIAPVFPVLLCQPHSSSTGQLGRPHPPLPAPTFVAELCQLP